MINPELSNRRYLGNGQRQQPSLENFAPPDNSGIEQFLLKDLVKTPEPYIPDRELIKAVNVALYLRRPLLLEGEPGCGKTCLAFAVAYELGYPLKECYIRSTSRAQDLLYTYDALRRLYDTQARSRAEQAKALDRIRYVTFGPLGEAIRLAEHNIPSVVLIDEIDKADIDFPNDLLLALERLQFEIPEVNNCKFDALKAKAGQKENGECDQRRHVLPLIIITSNREKELPKPFLRRCLYHYIKFPARATLEQIVQTHLPQKETASSLLVDAAVTKFAELRSPNNSIRWRKTPGTSELLDWVKVLLLDRDEQAGGIDADSLRKTPLKDLPHLETLVKTQSDNDALAKIKPKNTD